MMEATSEGEEEMERKLRNIDGEWIEGTRDERMEI